MWYVWLVISVFAGITLAIVEEVLRRNVCRRHKKNHKVANQRQWHHAQTYEKNGKNRMEEYGRHRQVQLEVWQNFERQPLPEGHPETVFNPWGQGQQRSPYKQHTPSQHQQWQLAGQQRHYWVQPMTKANQWSDQQRLNTNTNGLHSPTLINSSQNWQYQISTRGNLNSPSPQWGHGQQMAAGARSMPQQWVRQQAPPFQSRPPSPLGLALASRIRQSTPNGRSLVPVFNQPSRNLPMIATIFTGVPEPEPAYGQVQRSAPSAATPPYLKTLLAASPTNEELNVSSFKEFKDEHLY